MAASTPSRLRAAWSFASNAATESPSTRSKELGSPRLVAICSRWSMKSKSISKLSPLGACMRRVVRPLTSRFERHVPPVIERRGRGKPHLADDLGPEVERLLRRFPLGERERREPRHFPRRSGEEQVDAAAHGTAPLARGFSSDTSAVSS